jgi:hypothetical protein
MHPSRVLRIGSWIRRALIVGLLAGLAAASAGCGESLPPQVVPVVGDPSGPWQAQPFALEPAALAQVLAACRGMIAPNRQVTVVDARGEDRAGLIAIGPQNTVARCSLIRNPDGSFAMHEGSESSGGLPPPPPAPNEVALDSVEGQGGGLDANGLAAPGQSWAYGRVGGNVAGVELVVVGRPVRASVANGWFLAWWPSNDQVSRATAIAVDGGPLPPP